MVELPGSDVADLERLADWLELCVLIDGEVATSDVAEMFQSTALAGYAKSEFFSGDESFDDEDILSEQETAERLAEMIWEQCEGRAQLLGDGYPFTLARGMARLAVEDAGEAAGYTMLLLVDLGFHYELGDLLEPSSNSSRLFEKVVEASHRGLLGGRCSRFGWPREPGWPTGIDERIHQLGSELELPVENLAGKTEPNDKDRGLDVAGRSLMYDDEQGSFALITQCATGRSNWKEKRGEPALSAWENVFQWNARLLRGVAVPWRLTSSWDRRRVHMYFEAVVLDRPRLLAGRPDSFLSAELKAQIANWCQPILDALPRPV